MLKSALEKFEAYLDRPIAYRARFLILLLVLPLLLTFFQPLWSISMKAPQYPEGLEISIYAHCVEGGNEGRDIGEINTLNHYIGMAPIEGTLLADLDWIPFLFGLLVLLSLRTAAIGNIRTLIDLAVIYSYVCGFLAFRFWYHLYSLGHNLDPRAAVDIEPFMPAIFGSKQVANFYITSMPRAGSIGVGISIGGILSIMLWHLITGYLTSKRNAAQASATPASSS